MLKHLTQIPTDLFKLILDEYHGIEDATKKYKFNEFIINEKPYEYNLSEIVINYINKYDLKKIKNFDKDFFSKEKNLIFNYVLSYYKFFNQYSYDIELTIEQFIMCFCELNKYIEDFTIECLYEDIEDYFGYLYQEPDEVGENVYREMEYEYFTERNYSPDILEEILQKIYR